MTETVSDRVRRVTQEHLGVAGAAVTDTASFIDDLGADSLDAIELVMALEEEFQLELTDEEIERIATVGQVIKLIQSKLG